jgi:hypothetical protein
MIIPVKIDLTNVYKLNSPSNNLREVDFDAELADGSKRKLMIKIDEEEHELLPNVYNLSFGPEDEDGEIDPYARLRYKDYSKVFSTILWHARVYFSWNPDHWLGIDGSDNSRFFLYYRYIQQNYDYLSKYFKTKALKYYVRITRFGKKQYENPFDFNDIKDHFVDITQERSSQDDPLYNYFIFSSNNLLTINQYQNGK